MKAAIITPPGAVPELGEFAEPHAAEGEVVVSVTAAPISPIVRLRAAQAQGGDASIVAGIDGVGTTPDGRRVYFLFPKAPFGALAERTLVPAALTVPVPGRVDDPTAAALATSGLASWVALTRRAPMVAGQTVLVAGANGAAGRIALEIARHLGAGRTIAVTRSAAKLERLSADTGIALDGPDADRDLKTVFDAGVDIVLDFVWGETAGRLISAATTGRGSPNGEHRMRYLVLGTSGGATVPLSGYGLQSSGLELLGSGIGSVQVRDYLAAAGDLLGAAATGALSPRYEVARLSDIVSIWGQSADRRFVVRPDDKA